MVKTSLPIEVVAVAENTTGVNENSDNPNHQNGATEDKIDLNAGSVNVTNTTNADGSPLNPQRRTSATKNRKKSRRMTRVQGCPREISDSAPTRVELAHPAETESASISTSFTSFDSVDSRTSSSTSSSLKMGSERKINRIFSMLQRMQHNLFQQQQHQQQPDQLKQLQDQQLDNNQKAMASNSGNDNHSETRKLNSIRPKLLQPELNQTSMSSDGSSRRLFGLGRSQDSLMSARTRSMAKLNPRNHRLNSVNSWTDSSQFSGLSYTTEMNEETTPPLVHAMPYHKDGWTSLFIVGSSTYAQLLIVICIVAALAEVVSHNVPFFYFEVYFAYLYLGSIVFFIYVFGYLLQSKRKREEKKRLRKLSKSRKLSHMTSYQSSEESDGNKNQVSHNAVISIENEYVDSSVGRFIVSSTEGQRRRFSRTNSEIKGESGNLASQNLTPLQEKPSLQCKTTPSEIVSYSLADERNDNPSATSSSRKSKKMKVSDNEHSHGSFFLRVGAVAFGLGTMIYDGLEFGAFLEVPLDSPCFALLRGLNPLLNAVFVFLQMYFIFISARLNIHKFKAIARFGLMHCLATNVCVWIRTLVRESLKEINGHLAHYEKTHSQMKFRAAAASSDNFLHHVAEVVAAVVGNHADNSNEGSSSYEFVNDNDTLAEVIDAAVKSVKSSKKVTSLWELTGNVSCGHRFVLGDLIMDAAPFLYPFLIEYSLIGAAVIYVTWSHIGVNPKYYKTEENNQNDPDESIWNSKSRQLRIDCIGTSKGLFVGLIFLVASLLCLILFFIFTPQPQFHRLGLFLADTAHCVLLFVSLCAMALGAYRARQMHFHADHEEELGSILLRISALGMFAYSVFSMIAGALTVSSSYEPPLLVFINGLLSLIEVTAQTLYISDMSRRSVNTPEQNREKPGRQAVTFLLITNMTLWLVYTFEMQKVEANPVQLNFYGFLPWAIVQRLTLPLCIFYRFHSAIVYSEIWKNSYRYHAHQQ